MRRALTLSLILIMVGFFSHLCLLCCTPFSSSPMDASLFDQVQGFTLVQVVHEDTSHTPHECSYCIGDFAHVKDLDAQEESLGTGAVTKQPPLLTLVKNQHKSLEVVGTGVPGMQKIYLRLQRFLN